MDVMKRALAFTAILLLFGAAAAQAEPGAQYRFSNRLLGDVVEMTRAGLSDETIVAYVTSRRVRLDADVSAQDLIRLRQAGVSESVVRAIAGASGVSDREVGRPGQMTYDSSGVEGEAAEPSGGEDVAYDSPRPYGYRPYWYAWYGDPWWYGYGYGPYVSSTFFFGGGRSFRGRGSDHRGHGPGHGTGGHRGRH
jgi:hypothetical protein